MYDVLQNFALLFCLLLEFSQRITRIKRPFQLKFGLVAVVSQGLGKTIKSGVVFAEIGEFVAVGLDEAGL